MSECKPSSISELAIATMARQRAALQLFTQTQLADVPHTPENVELAVQAVKQIGEHARSLLELSVIQRGMYLCWLKTGLTAHGEWEAFCDKRFPEVPERSRRRWMAAYLLHTGQKRPKELPAYSADELDDEQLVEAVDALSTDKLEVAPRRAILDHARKLQARIEKGQEQLAETRQEIEQLREQIERQRTERFVPPEVADESDRLMQVRAAFGHFLSAWRAACPTDLEAFRLHKGLLTELADRLDSFFHDELMPMVERAQGAGGRKHKRTD